MQTSTDARQSTTVRIIHGAFVSGVVLFAIVIYFVVRPRWTGEPLPPLVVNVVLAISLAASGLSFLVMRRRVPPRNTDESADLYWPRAALPALLTWAPLEGGALLAIVAYLLSGSTAALAVGAVALFGLIALHPGSFERV